MQNYQQIRPPIDYLLLQKQYPGIKNKAKQLQKNHQQHLIKICNLIKYNFPKQYYSSQILAFAQQLQQISINYLHTCNRQMQEQSQQIIEESQTVYQPISDEIQAVSGIVIETNLQPAQKYNVDQIRRFISRATLDNIVKFVNPNIINSVHKLQNIKSQLAVYQNYHQKQKLDKKNVLKKTYSAIIKDISPVKQKKISQKPQMTITIGGNISKQVKNMRNYVKTSSMQSFAITSLESQQKKTDLQKSKLVISLALNKVAKNNMKHIFLEIYPLIVQSKQLGSFLVNQIINKCVLQFKMISVYLDFLIEFMQIFKVQYQWSIAEFTKHSQNQIHCLFTHKLEQQFEYSLQNVQYSYKLKNYGYIIGILINKRRFSRKIFLHISKKLINKLLTNSCKQLICEFQNYFECLICLIEQMNTLYEQIWEFVSFQQYFKQQIIRSKKQGEVLSFNQFLNYLNKISNFPTSRIQCLIKNLFERKNQIKSQQNFLNINTNVQNKHSAQISKILKQQNGFQNALAYYTKHQNVLILHIIIIAIFDGSQQQVTKNMNQFKKLQMVGYTQFNECLQQNIVDFTFQQCDLPFMISGIAILLIYYSRQNASRWNIQIQKQSENYQDTLQFISKINAKINYYLNLDSLQLCH